MDPQGKVALVTGGARIGQAVAHELAQHGCSLALIWRESRGSAETSADAARAAGVRAVTLQADALDETQVGAAVDRAARELGSIDILINMASTYTSAPLASLGSRAWAEAVDSNARSAFLFSVKAAPHMRKAGAGRIVNFSDWTAVSGRPRYTGYAPYYIAKAAVAGMTESLALELAPDILVNAIAPGPILPPPDLSDEDSAKVIAATPLRRWGGAEEIARAVLFLVQTEFVTGECLRVDGGRHLY
ncbi:MAG TPA: SDR family oxidoreductase [Patescibacteria group bacterium]|jgi:NAD(P)-dependent dehydrogenase (short-subunit alcohol dehydrogenase family)|nr:SDR family oxidoreductase [Patescibacteria group bacterium]